MSRFFTDPSNIGDSHIYLDSKEDINHIKNVLRMKEGDELWVSDSDAWEYGCVIEEIDRERIILRIEDKQAFAKEPDLKVTLFQGVPKGSKMDDVVRKTTELGVSAIVPVFMDRSVVKDTGSYSKKISRMRTIAEQAAKQCRRGMIPEISDQMSFGEMMGKIGEFDLGIFAYENEEKTTLKDVFKTLESVPRTVAVIIGPEGGFSDAEAEKLRLSACRSASLGRTILRTETAGIAALSMIMYELEL